MKSWICLTFIFLPHLVLAQTSFIEVATSAKPSIVEVTALVLDMYKSPQTQAALDPRSGRLIVVQKGLTNYKEKSGAGVIIDPSGVIVTNLHTVYQAPHIFVKLNTGEKLEAKLITIMADYDLVLLKIDPPKTLPFLLLADSNLIHLGDPVINVGNSFFLKETVSEGKIVGIGMKDNDIEFIKINVNLYKGDSGGPVLNSKRELIGMIEAKLRGQDKQTLIIPSNKIKKLYKENTP
jgi:S1-C subfamily serine protease